MIILRDRIFSDKDKEVENKKALAIAMGTSIPYTILKTANTENEYWKKINNSKLTESKIIGDNVFNYKVDDKVIKGQGDRLRKLAGKKRFGKHLKTMTIGSIGGSLLYTGLDELMKKRENDSIKK